MAASTGKLPNSPPTADTGVFPDADSTCPAYPDIKVRRICVTVPGKHQRFECSMYRNFCSISLLLLATIGLGACGAREAPDSQRQQMQRLMSSFAGDERPGVQVGVYRQGQILFQEGWGLANLEAGSEMTAHTPIWIASVSKQFVAFSILLLEHEGKLSLDDDVKKYLPYLPDFEEVVTLRHLIAHTGGIRGHFALFLLGGRDLDDRLEQKQVRNIMARQRGLNFKPGTEWRYSNGGYALLADVVERVSGQTFRSFVTDRIFGPLKMSQTWVADDPAEIIRGRARSYAAGRKDGQWIRDPLNHQLYGAAGVVTTAEDMLKWAANFHAPVVGDAALIARFSQNIPLDDGTPIAYGFGLQRKDFAGHTVLLHTGSESGYRALFCYVPKHDFAVMIAANYAEMPLERFALLRRIMAIYLPPVEERGAEPEDRTANLAALAGDYVAPKHYAFSLVLRDGELFRHDIFGEGARVIVRTDGRFDFGGEVRTYYEPVTDAQGRVVAIDEWTPEWARRIRYERYIPAQPAQESLGAYLGRYYSDELDITYSVSMRSDHTLILHSLWTPEALKMVPVLPDRFDTVGWPQGNLIFQRDAEGRITGLLMHDGYGRERDMPLRRVDDVPQIWVGS